MNLGAVALRFIFALFDNYQELRCGSAKHPPISINNGNAIHVRLDLLSDGPDAFAKHSRAYGERASHQVYKWCRLGPNSRLE